MLCLALADQRGSSDPGEIARSLLLSRPDTHTHTHAHIVCTQSAVAVGITGEDVSGGAGNETVIDGA